MTSLIAWTGAIVASVAALVLTSAMKLYYLHILVAALTSVAVALRAFQGGRPTSIAPADASKLLSGHLRDMGLVWTWGALALLSMYATQILTWREWPQFFAVFAALAALCLFVGRALAKDAAAGSDDGTMVGIARILVLAQLVAMPIVMLGLLVDGKMWRFTTAAGQRANWQDWGANNVFFFGALAIAALAWNAWSVLRARAAK